MIRWKKRFSTFMIHAFILIILFVTLYPFFVMIAASFKTNMQLYEDIFFFSIPLHYEHYAMAWPQIAPYMLNSVIVAAATILLTLVVSMMAGYAFARYEFFGKSVLFYLVLMMMMVPYFLILIPQFIMARNMEILNTYTVQILPAAGAFSILSTFLIRTQVEGLPESLFEAAAMEGCGDFRMFTRIAMPLSKPTLAVVLITTLVSSWNNYIWPLVSANQANVRPVVLAVGTITAGITQRQGVQFAGYVLASIPLLLVFSFATKPFVEGLTAGAIKA